MIHDTHWRDDLEAFDDTSLDEDEPDAEFVAEDWHALGEDARGRWDLSRSNPGDDDGYFREVARDAREMLAAWGRLRRVRNDLVDESLLEDIERLVREDQDLIAELLEPLELLEGWLETAEEWERQALNEPLDARARATRAVHLLRQLDEAELIVWALEQLDDEPDEHAKRSSVEPLVAWFCERTELFTDASRYVRPSLAAFRADLSSRDPTLALTQVKFLQIAKDIEREKQWRRGDHVEPFDREVLESWLDAKADDEETSSPSIAERTRRKWRERTPRTQTGVSCLEPLPEDRSRHASASDQSVGGEQRNKGDKIVWLGADESWRALMRLPKPEQAGDDREVKLYLQQYPDAHTVCLFGLTRTLSEDGVATFTMDELRDVWAREGYPALAVIDDAENIEFGRLEE